MEPAYTSYHIFQAFALGWYFANAFTITVILVFFLIFISIVLKSLGGAVRRKGEKR